MGQEHWDARTRLLIGEEGVERLAQAHVLVVGLGGVGGYALEALVRAGVGHLTLADGDALVASNLNRQILATHDSLGHRKVEVAAQRARSINPAIEIETVDELLHDEPLERLAAGTYTVAVDAIDTLTPKCHLIRCLLEADTPFVSAMGAGGRLDASAVRVAPFWETRHCPLAALLRKRLRRMGVKGNFYAVYSDELPHPSAFEAVEGESYKRSRVGVISYLPALMGLHAASVALRIALGESGTFR